MNLLLNSSSIVSLLIVNERKHEFVIEILIRILIDLLHRAHNLHKEVKKENRNLWSSRYFWPGKKEGKDEGLMLMFMSN